MKQTQKQQDMKNPQYLKDQKMLGYVGECYVKLELAKRGLYAQRMHKDFLQDYDLLLSNGLTVEVKTSSIIIAKDHRRKNYSREVWGFNNYKRVDGGKMVGRHRECDYFILVCMDKKSKPIRYLIVPSMIISSRQAITIPVKRKLTKEFSIDEYENKWEFLE